MNYENIKVIKKTNDLLILVNKQNKLPNNYIPSVLVLIPSKYCSENKYVKKEVLNRFIEMHNEGKIYNLNILIASAYRDSNYQDNLYKNYVKEKGIDYADKCSARKGHSEHQTGLAIDVMGKNMDYDLFEETDEFKWMTNNSYKYGFILRYPKNKEEITGFKYEPWHYRYVGIKVATEIHDLDITLEEFLKSIS